MQVLTPLATGSSLNPNSKPFAPRTANGGGGGGGATDSGYGSGADSAFPPLGVTAGHGRRFHQAAAGGGGGGSGRFGQGHHPHHHAFVGRGDQNQHSSAAFPPSSGQSHMSRTNGTAAATTGGSGNHTYRPPGPPQSFWSGGRRHELPPPPEPKSPLPPPSPPPTLPSVGILSLPSTSQHPAPSRCRLSSSAPSAPLSVNELGLRNLAGDLLKGSNGGRQDTAELLFKDKTRMCVSEDELGFTDYVRRNFAPLHRYLDSPFRESLATPMAACEVPHEYLNSLQLENKLPKLNEIPIWPTEVLFFLFYTATGDQMQIWAGDMLYDKGWRYIKPDNLWVARYPKQPPDFRTDRYEKGTYQCWNVNKWWRETRQLTLHYDHLAQRTMAGGPTANGNSNNANEAALAAAAQLFDAMQQQQQAAAAKRRREQQQQMGFNDYAATPAERGNQSGVPFASGHS